MKVDGIGWLGTRTGKWQEMVNFAEEVLGLAPSYKEQDFAVYELPDGSLFEVFGPSDKDHPFMVAPVAGFLVEDVATARTEMEAHGVEFIGPIHDVGTAAWSHFRGPDGNIYEINHRHDRH